LHGGVRSLDQEGTNDPAACYAFNAVPRSNGDVVVADIRVNKDRTVVRALFWDICVLNNVPISAQRNPVQVLW
jgi:hypothetical protein